MNQDSLLLDSVPVRLLASLRDLPKRLLFRNEHLQMLLAGLHAGQTLVAFEAPGPLLVVVAFGEVELCTGPDRRWHREGEDFRLDAGRPCDLVARGETDLLFFIPAKPPPRDPHRFALRMLGRNRRPSERIEDLGLRPAVPGPA